jgi:hypothetical protein
MPKCKLRHKSDKRNNTTKPGGYLYEKTYGVGYADVDHLHIRLCRKCGRCAERLQAGQKSLESCGVVQGR